LDRQSRWQINNSQQQRDRSHYVTHSGNLTDSPAQAHTGLGFAHPRWHTCGMTTTEQQLLEALKKLEAAVAGINSQPKPDLMTHFDRIDALAAELPDGTDGELLHYLHKKGYQKARLYLEGRFSEIEKGGCLR
jgi:hypothetical protein